jgi:putative OPT family oligopeptide transporter
VAHYISVSSGVENWNLGVILGMPEYMNGIWYLSLLTVGVAYLAGRGGFFFVVGGYVCYWLLAPLLSLQDRLPTPAVLAEAGMGMATFLRLNLFRPVGIGMIIGGALTGIVFALPLVLSAIRSMQRASRTRSAVATDELPIKLLYLGIAGAVSVLAVTATLSVPDIEIWRAVAMAVVGTLWIWVAGVVLSECIGRTQWSPLSGMTLIGITILIFVASGLGDEQTVIASIVVGGAMCVAMAQATDLMLDLKTGYLVGAIPRKQQIAQFLGTWLGPILIMGLIVVLHQAHGLGSDALPAPQGQALASMIDGILGGNVPLEKYMAGAGLGAILSASGVGGLGVMVGLGFYLPFNIILTYTIGTLARVFTDAKMGRSFAEDIGIPVAAGLIVGEALIGVFHALMVVWTAG